MPRFGFGTVVKSVPMQLLISQIVVAGGALTINIVSARALGPGTRGELALALQVSYILNVVCLLGRHRSFLRFDPPGAGTWAHAHVALLRATRLPAILGIVMAVILALLVESELVRGLIFVASMAILITSGIQQKTHRSAAIVARSAKLYLMSTIVGQIVLLAASIGMAVQGVDDLLAWIAVYGLAVFLPYLVVDCISLRRTSSDRPEIDRPTLNLGLRLVPTTVAEMVGSRADRLLLPVLAGFPALGVYTVVVTVTELVSWPVRQYTEANVPAWSRQFHDGRLQGGREALRVVSLSLVLAVLVGVSLLALLVPVFGTEYRSGLGLVFPLSIAAFLHAISYFCINLALASGLTGMVNIIPLVSMAVSFAAYLFLIPQFGALGAAWGLGIGYLSSLIPGFIAFSQSNRRNVLNRRANVFYE